MIDSPESSIVKVLYEKGGVAGAGFLVGKSWVLTCRHVIEDVLPNVKIDDEINLTFLADESKKILNSRVHFLADENSDFAILELGDEAPSCAVVGKLVITNTFWDRKLKVCGFSSGKDGEWVSAVGRERSCPNYVQIDVSTDIGYRIEEGFSGTPVFDAELNYIIGIIVSKEISKGVLSGCFTPINSIITVCKSNNVNTKNFESLYIPDLLNTPLDKIANLIVTSLVRLLDKERRNDIINDIVNRRNINLKLWLKDEDLCYPLAMAMLNLGLNESLPILTELWTHSKNPKDRDSEKEIISIFNLLVPSWVDSKSAACIYDRSLHKDNKKSVALNANEHFSAKMCIRRASSLPPDEWPAYSCLGKFGTDTADEILSEIENLLMFPMLKSGLLDDNLILDEQRNKLRTELKEFICFYKRFEKPTFFIFNYSKNIIELLPPVQEIFPCITLFLLTGDIYPQQEDFGNLDCECLSDLGLNAEEKMLNEIRHACGYLKIDNVVEKPRSS